MVKATGDTGPRPDNDARTMLGTTQLLWLGALLGKSLSSIDGQIAFRLALEKHCREASVIVQEFAGGWFAKSNYRSTLNPTTAQNFANYALKKVCDELRARRAADV
jgi:hypothetical protein